MANKKQKYQSLRKENREKCRKIDWPVEKIQRLFISAFGTDAPHKKSWLDENKPIAFVDRIERPKWVKIEHYWQIAKITARQTYVMQNKKSTDIVVSWCSCKLFHTLKCFQTEAIYFISFVLLCLNLDHYLFVLYWPWKR